MYLFFVNRYILPGHLTEVNKLRQLEAQSAHLNPRKFWVRTAAKAVPMGVNANGHSVTRKNEQFFCVSRGTADLLVSRDS